MKSCAIFIKNGDEGIKKLEKKLSLWENFNEIFKTYEHSYSIEEKYNFFELFINNQDKTIKIIKEDYVKQLVRVERKLNINETIKNIIDDLPITINQCDIDIYIKYGNIKFINKYVKEYELKQALAKYNLELRSDSELCRNYITSEKNINGEEFNIDNIVNIMRKMNFLYKKTEYKSIYGKLLSDAYYAANDYYYDEDDDGFDPADYVDKHDISQQAQIIALKKYNKVLPDFLRNT